MRRHSGVDGTMSLNDAQNMVSGRIPDWWTGNSVSIAHSYRNFSPVDVANLIYATDRLAGRKVLNYIESGRFEPALDRSHNMIVRMDLDEIRDYWRGSPEWTRWVSVWAVANRASSPVMALPRDVPLWPNDDGPDANFMKGGGR